jgi:SLOG family YspA-like protein
MAGKTIIAGCRHWQPSVADIEQAVRASGFEVTTLLSGHGGGVDLAAEQWAALHGIPVELFLPDWQRYGRAAGPRRNRHMAEAADGLIALWDGKSPGTGNMSREAQKRNLPVFVWHWRP